MYDFLWKKCYYIIGALLLLMGTPIYSGVPVNTNTLGLCPKPRGFKRHRDNLWYMLV
jgi:hypothetical protein